MRSSEEHLFLGVSGTDYNSKRNADTFLCLKWSFYTALVVGFLMYIFGA